MIPIKGSSNLEAVGYDARSGILSVRFKDGGHVYHYQNVSTAQHAAMTSAKSKGAWLVENIVKKPQAHPYKREAVKG